MRSLILVSTLLLAACGSGDTVSLKDSEGNDRSLTVEENGNKRTVSSKDGLIKAEGTTGGENARFPEFAPQYPGAKVQSVVDMDIGTPATGGVKQHMITMATTDAPEEVIAFYKAKISSSGKSFKEVKSATGPMLMVGGTDPLSAEAYVTAMAAGASGTSVNVAVQNRVAAQ